VGATSNILYVPRKNYERARGNPIAMRAIELKSFLFYSDINAFFESSLRQAGNVKEIALDALVSRRKSLNQLDSMVVHYRCTGSMKGSFEEAQALAGPFAGTKALYIDDDKPETMAPDNIVDTFDLIFKREAFKDLDRYRLSFRNKAKIRPTMLSCKLFSKYKLGQPHLRRSISRLLRVPVVKKHDIFFSGKSTSARQVAFRSLIRSGFSVMGGLQESNRVEADLSLLRDRLSVRAYVDMMRSSAVNIAIGGHGPFTFRHLEILCVGGFLLSDDAICDLWLPIPLQDGRHMVTFRGEGDLVEKVSHYLSHHSERVEIAKRGSQMFIDNYDTTKHGKFIRSCLNGAVEFEAAMSELSVGA
jgi:hypothetical protein